MATSPCTPEHEQRGGGGLLLAPALFVLLLGTSPAQAKSDIHPQTRGPICPMLMLLMDFECLQYQQRLGHALSPEERLRIDREYWQLGEERRRSCRCNASRELHGKQDDLTLDGLVCQ